MTSFYKVLDENFMADGKKFQLGINRAEDNAAPTELIKFYDKDIDIDWFKNLKICKVRVPVEYTTTTSASLDKKNTYTSKYIIIDAIYDTHSIEGIEWMEKEGIKVEWMILSLLETSVEFLKHFQDKIEWKRVLCNPSISQEFMTNVAREFGDRLDWEMISYRNINMSKEFMEEFKDKLDWNMLSATYEFTIECSEKYADRIEWRFLPGNSNLQESFYKYFFDKFNKFSCGNLAARSDFSDEFKAICKEKYESMDVED